MCHSKVVRCRNRVSSTQYSSAAGDGGSDFDSTGIFLSGLADTIVDDSLLGFLDSQLNEKEGNVVGDFFISSCDLGGRENSISSFSIPDEQMVGSSSAEELESADATTHCDHMYYRVDGTPEVGAETCVETSSSGEVDATTAGEEVVMAETVDEEETSLSSIVDMCYSDNIDNTNVVDTAVDDFSSLDVLDLID